MRHLPAHPAAGRPAGRRGVLGACGRSPTAVLRCPRAYCGSAPKAPTRRSATRILRPGNWPATTSTSPMRSASGLVRRSNSSRPMGFHLRSAGSQPVRRGGQRSHHHPERQSKYDISEPYSVGEGVVITRANDNSITSVADLKGKTVGATVTSNWAQVSRDAGAKLEPVEGFTQASPCSTRAGSTPWSTTASPSTPTRPRPTTSRSRSAPPSGRRASRASRPGRTAACCPS